VKADNWKQGQGRYSDGKKVIEFEIMAIRGTGNRMSKLTKNRNEKEEN